MGCSSASTIASDCKSVNLTPGDRESVPDRDFDVFVPRVVNMRMVDDDIFVRWKRKPDMDLEIQCHGDAYGSAR